MTRWRKWRRRLLAVFLSFLLICVLLEVGLRLFTNIGVTLLVRDEQTGRRYDANFRGKFYIHEAGREIDFRFSKDGYRGPDRPRKKPAGVRRIAVIGDSFIAATGVDEQDMMTSRLERHLGDGWEVLNFGVSGNSTGQALLTWRHVARHYEVETVIFFFTIMNDVVENSGVLSSTLRPYFDLADDGSLELHAMSRARGAGSRLLRHSRLYNWQKHLTRMAGRRFKKMAKTMPREMTILEPELTPEFAHAWKITERIIATAKAEIEATGTEFRFAVVPSIGQYDTEVWKAILEYWEGKADHLDPDFPDRQLAGIVQRHGIQRIPLLPGFRAARKDGRLNFSWGHVAGHWNEAGNAAAARAIHRYLVESGLVD